MKKERKKNVSENIICNNPESYRIRVVAPLDT